MPSAIATVVFDAGGTLFEVREPVGETYARVACAHGFPVSADATEAGFRRAAAASPPLAAPRGLSDADRLAFERAWWRSVVERSIGEALGDPAAPRRSPAASMRCFEELFALYAEPHAWRLYPDTKPVLAELDARGLRLGVLSNFDGRLHRLVDGLGLSDHFSAVIASSEAGAAKPDGAAFAAVARALAAGPPKSCLHVGDSLHDDVGGALAAGFGAAWLVRESESASAALAASDAAGGGHSENRTTPTAAVRLASLAELPALLGSIA